MTDRERRRWWIPGCLIVVALAAVGAAVLGGRVWWAVREADPSSQTLTRDDPETVATEEPGPGTASAGPPLKLVFELDSCETYVEPGAPGEPLHVEAHYDAGDYRLEERIDDADPDTYRVRFLITSSRLITGIKQGLRGGQPQLRIRLPVDRPIELRLVQRNGGAIVDLSGLRLNAADFDVGGALLKVDADTPLRGDLERFSVEGTQGGIVLESLNLMQPRHLALDFRMGQVQLDFRGPWKADTQIDLSMSLLDAIVRLPRGARIQGLGEGGPGPVSEPELGLPTLTFDVETGKRAQLRVFE